MISSDLCPICLKPHKIFYRNICHGCYENQLTSKRLDEIKDSFNPASSYNERLFDLYLSYTKKCRLKISHGHQAQELKDILEREKIPTIMNWNDIYSLSEKYQLWELKKKKRGCAFKKIGLTLCGLGVLEPSWKEGRPLKRQKNLRAEISIESLSLFDLFIEAIRKRQKLSLRTIVTYLGCLSHLEKWLKKNSDCSSAVSASHEDIISYFDSLRNSEPSLHNIYGTYVNLNRFYRWCALEKKIFYNPVSCIKIKSHQKSYKICSKNDLKKLISYIKSEDTCAANAFLLSLFLYFGFTLEKICLAQLISFQNGSLCIEIEPFSRGHCKRFNNRKQSLILPNKPLWFSKLQHRYYEYWTQKFSQIKKISSRRPLILSENGWYNVPVETSLVSRRLALITKEATSDKSIPSRVIRNTCAALFIRYDDASILVRLGWSSKQSYAHTYINKAPYLQAD